MRTHIFLSRPSWRPAFQFSQRAISSGFLWNESMQDRCFTARKPENNKFIWSETRFHMLLADRTDCLTRLFYLPRFGAGRLFYTWATTLFFYAVTAAALCWEASAMSSYSRIPWFDTLWLPIVTQAKLQLAHGVYERCCPLYLRQRNNIETRLSQLYRRYWCAQEHLCFNALTTFSPSISRYKRSHTRTDQQDGNSNDDPIFSNSLSLRQTTHSPGSFSSHIDGSYKDPRTFTASLLVHLGPLSGLSPSKKYTRNTVVS